MLGGLLKPGWQHKSPEKRLQAVAKLSSTPADQTVLAKLALHDTEQTVRIASINKLDDLTTLFQIVESDSNESVNNAAKQQLIKLIGQSTNVSQDDAQRLLNEHPKCRILFAEHYPDAELRHRLIEQLNQIEIASLVADVAYLETRKLIADRLTDVAALELAKKNLKGKDKSSEKIIRKKLDLIKSELKQTETNNAVAKELCEQIEFIANHPEWRDEFKDRFKLYQQRWSALSFSMPMDLQSRFDKATNIAQSKVDDQIAIEDTQTSQRQLVTKLEQYCRSLTVLDFSVLEQEKTSINSILSDAIHQWLEDGKLINPPTDLANRFSKAQNALSSLSEFISVDAENLEQYAKATQQISWPAAYPELLALTQARDNVDERQAQTAQQKQDLKDNLDKLHKRINRLIGTTNKGDIRKAKQELSATTKAAQNYSGKERNILDERLVKAAETVNKMSDWQAFATEPKLIELCDAMEALKGVKTHPDKLAKQISNLQGRWKSLGHSDITDLHWPRFKAAADIAYQPCSTFFEERKNIRSANLEKREPLIIKTKSLLDNTDWDDEVDYKSVETQLRNINNEWRKIKDVERQAGQKQWQRLSKIKDSIYAKLDVVYDANIELKNQLIEQVTKLSDNNIDDNTVVKLQLFQSRWKQVGVTRRKQDQAAWLKFKAASDAIYAQVQDTRKVKRDEQDQELNAYRNVINAITALTKSSNTLSELEKGVSTLQSDYATLPPFTKNIHEKAIERIDSDYQRALNLVTKASERLIDKQKSNKQSLFKRIAELCSKLEAKSAEQDDDEIASLTTKIDELIVDDKSLQQHFSERLAMAKSIDREAYTAQRRKLCIELEILFDLDSPKADRSQRMQMQLERMQNKGLGKTAKTTEQLQMDWWCLPGAEPNEQILLDKRVKSLMASA